MDLLTIAIIGLPFLAAISLAALNRIAERALSKIIYFFAIFYVVSCLSGVVLWILEGSEAVVIDLFSIAADGYPAVRVSMLWDLTSVVYLSLTAFCCATIIRFSKHYMHREQGYARFFSVVFLLICGISLLCLSDNLDMFFVGWELIGLASFLLISFYRDRPSSVRNAMLVFSVYRVGDLGLLIGVWLSHLMPPDAPFGFDSYKAFNEIVYTHMDIAFIPLSIALMTAASAKSAQFPYCFWLPKAMEGPTPSSAIFYGALSIHAGVLLLMRTMPLWYPFTFCRCAIAAIGILSAITATMTGRTQASIKGQLAYASVTQVGVMFIELALGFETFALYHLVAHALLRTFQILVSPSIIVDSMQKDRLENRPLTASRWSLENLLSKKLRVSLYVLAIQDVMLERFFKKYVVELFQGISDLIRERILLLTFVGGVFILSVLFMGTSFNFYFTSLLFIGFQFIFSLLALFEQKNAKRVFDFVAISFAFATLALLPHDHKTFAVWFFIISFLPFWVLARLLLGSWESDGVISIYEFKGFANVQPGKFWALFGVCCFMASVPPSPLFFAEDYLMHGISEMSKLAAVPVGISMSLCGLALFRCLALVGMGPRVQVIDEKVRRPVDLNSILPAHH